VKDLDVTLLYCTTVAPFDAETLVIDTPKYNFLSRRFRIHQT